MTRFLCPCDEGVQRAFDRNMDHRHCSLVHGLCEFLVNEFVTEVDGSGIPPGNRIVDLGDTRPIDCTEAHGAWFATGIDLRSGQVKCPQFPASVSDGDDFGMGRRVIGLQHIISALCDDDAILDNHGAERSAVPLFHALPGQRDGSFHQRSAIRSGWCGHSELLKSMHPPAREYPSLRGRFRRPLVRGLILPPQGAREGPRVAPRKAGRCPSVVRRIAA